MKRRTAIIGSSLIGVAAAVVAAAGPANAVGPTISTACTNETQHVIGSAGGANWYMDCIPKYGAGKAEFTIAASSSDPTATFPAGFEPLTNSAVTTTASVDTPAGVAPYFGGTAPTNGFLDFTQDTADSTASRQVYTGAMLYSITSVQQVAVSDLPADCATSGDPYLSAWEVTYAPSTVTYDQTVDGKKYDYTITSDPKPLFLGLPLNTADNNAFDPADSTVSFCASDGTNFIQSSTEGDDAEEYIFFVHATSVPTGIGAEALTLSPYPSYDPTNNSIPPSIGELGTFDPAVPKPVLATTGVDPMPADLLGASLAIVGCGAVVVGRRKRRASRAN